MREINYQGDFREDIKNKKNYKYIIPKVIAAFLIWAGIEMGSFELIRSIAAYSIPMRVAFMAFTAGTLTAMINVLNKINNKGLSARNRLKQIEFEMRVDNHDLELESDSLENALLIDKSKDGYVDDYNNSYVNETYSYEVSDANDKKEYLDYIKSFIINPEGDYYYHNKVRVHNNPKVLKKSINNYNKK